MGNKNINLGLIIISINVILIAVLTTISQATPVLADSDSVIELDSECKSMDGYGVTLPQEPEGMVSKAVWYADENGCVVVEFSFITIAEYEALEDEIRNLPNLNQKTVSASWNATSTSNLDD